MKKFIFKVLVSCVITYIVCLILMPVYNIIMGNPTYEDIYKKALVPFFCALIIQVILLVILFITFRDGRPRRRRNEPEEDEYIGGENRSRISYDMFGNRHEESVHGECSATTNFDSEDSSEDEYTPTSYDPTPMRFQELSFGGSQVNIRTPFIAHDVEEREVPNANNDVFPMMDPDGAVLEIIRRYLTRHRITSCQNCGTILLTDRFGDYECPSCGQKFRLVSLGD